MYQMKVNITLPSRSPAHLVISTVGWTLQDRLAKSRGEWKRPAIRRKRTAYKEIVEGASLQKGCRAYRPNSSKLLVAVACVRNDAGVRRSGSNRSQTVDKFAEAPC